MNYRTIFLLLLSTLALSPPLFSQNYENDRDLLGNDFEVGIEGEININSQTNGRGALDLNNSYVTLTAEWKNKIRGVITTRLEDIFEENSVSLNPEFSLKEFIKEAYIEIREVDGRPIALVVGKQPMAFGQNVQAMPIFGDNPLKDDLQEIDEVYGFTIDLYEGIFGVFDQVEISVFESERKDLKIGKVDGLSVRLSKMLTEKWLLTASHSSQGNSHLDTGRESRTSIGLIGESSDGYLVGWIEGIYFSNNPRYQDSVYGFTAGGMIRVHETTDVIVEYNHIQKEIHEIGLGVRTALTRNLTVGGEVRLTNDINIDDKSLTFGINLNYTFGPRGRPVNQDYLFESKINDSEDDILKY